MYGMSARLKYASVSFGYPNDDKTAVNLRESRPMSSSRPLPASFEV